MSAACSLTHPRARYVRHEANLGPGPNFQAGLDQATGDYFMWLADDDWLDDDYVERCVEALTSDAHAVLANGDAVYYGNDRPAETEPGVSMTHASVNRRVVRLLHMGQPERCFLWGVDHSREAQSDTRRRVRERLDPCGGALAAARGDSGRAYADSSLARWATRRPRGASPARFPRPVAKLVAANIRTGAAYSHLRRADRETLAFACAAVVYWRKGVLNWFASRAASYLESRLSAARYEQVSAAPVILAAEATFRAPTKPNLSGQRDERCEHGPSERTKLRDRAPARMVTCSGLASFGNTAISSTS